MLLTWPMLVAGILSGLLELAAHHLMRGRTYITPIPRYAVGVVLSLIPYSIALAIEPGQEPTAGVWFVFGCAGLGTWLGYELDRPQPSDRDLEAFVPYIAGEHTDEPE